MIFLPLLGTVLAGGRSTRMGRCKAELPHASGGTFLDHAIEQLSVCCGQVACSVAADSVASPPKLPPGVRVVTDQSAHRGPVEGVRLAVSLARQLGCAGVLITPVDLPALNAEHLRQLIAAFDRAPGQAVVAMSDDAAVVKRLQPLVAIYPVSMDHDLESLARSADRGLYRFLEDVGCLSIELSAAVLHNVNSPDDLPS